MKTVAIVFFWMMLSLGAMAQWALQTDSLYATNVRVYVQEDSTTTPLVGASVELNSQSMGMSFVPRQYSALTNTQGFADFPKVLVGIDTTVSVPNMDLARTLVYAQGSSLILEHPRSVQGSVELYGLDGKKHKILNTTDNTFSIGLEDLSSGMYLLQAQFSNEELLRGKVFVENGQVRGLSASLQSQSPHNQTQHSLATAKLHSLFSADYQVIIKKEGFFPDTSSVTLEQGSNNPFIYTSLQAIPPPTVSVKYTVRDMDRNVLDGVLVVLKDTATGSIDTLRTNAQGEAQFNGLPQGASYFQALGGKDGFLAWDGTKLQPWSTYPNTFILTTPSSTINNTDTLLEKKFVLISDSLFSHLNNIKVPVSRYTIGEMFSCFNVHLGLHDTAYAHIKIASYNNDTLFVDQLKGMQQAISQNSGIPILHLDTPFNIPALWKPPNVMVYNPFTTPPREVGTNFANGPSTTYAKYYGFDNLPNSPFYGDNTIIACDSITTGGSANAWVKEHFRWFGAVDVSSRLSVMNGIPSTPTDIDFALINMYYHLARNRYQFQVHDLGNMNHLRDSIMILSVPWARKSNPELKEEISKLANVRISKLANVRISKLANVRISKCEN